MQEVYHQLQLAWKCPWTLKHHWKTCRHKRRRDDRVRGCSGIYLQFLHEIWRRQHIQGQNRILREKIDSRIQQTSLINQGIGDTCLYQRIDSEKENRSLRPRYFIFVTFYLGKFSNWLEFFPFFVWLNF